MKEKIIGFSPKKEENFLKRLPNEIRRVNLDQELKTQLAEDFCLVEFTLKYVFDKDENIVDIKSREKVMDVMIRGGVDEETESFRKIEQGLKEYPEKTWIHFSPKNGKLGYPENCVDFWRIEGGEIIWNRMVVKNDFEEMNEIRKFMSGEEKVQNELEILKSPIGVELKIVEIFDLFRLKESGNITDFREIEEVVGDYLNDFSGDFGDDLTGDSNLIFRLYSACYDFLSERKGINFDIWDYMYGQRLGERIENSFGCAAATTIGTFGERIGYFIVDGKVSYGEIPSGFKECKKCGCWYKGDKCPFC